MHENTGHPNKKSQPEGDFPKDMSKHDDRQKMRDEERDKKAADKNAEKVHGQQV